MLQRRRTVRLYGIQFQACMEGFQRCFTKMILQKLDRSGNLPANPGVEWWMVLSRHMKSRSMEAQHEQRSVSCAFPNRQDSFQMRLGLSYYRPGDLVTSIALHLFISSFFITPT